MRPCLLVLLAFTACGSPSGAPARPSPAAVVGADTPADTEAADLAACSAEPPRCRPLVERFVHAQPIDGAAPFVAAFRAACDRNDQVGCAGLAMAALRDPEVGIAAPRALELLAAGCRAGEPLACYGEADAVLGGRGMPQDLARGASLATASCERVGDAACYLAGTLHNDGTGVTKDTTRARARFERACTDGAAVGCAAAAESYIEANDAASGRAEQLARRGCDLGSAAGCVYLADLIAGPATGPDDDTSPTLPAAAPDAKAMAAVAPLVARACRLGLPAGCDAQFEIADTDTAAPPERLAAARRACADGGAEVCTIAGVAIVQAGDVDHYRDVVALLQRGCDRGSIAGCNTLGHLDRDASEACATGDATGCYAAALILERGVRMFHLSGRTVKPDPAAAAPLFDKACKGGVRAACAPR